MEGRYIAAPSLFYQHLPRPDTTIVEFGAYKQQAFRQTAERYGEGVALSFFAFEHLPLYVGEADFRNGSVGADIAPVAGGVGLQLYELWVWVAQTGGSAFQIADVLPYFIVH